MTPYDEAMPVTAVTVHRLRSEVKRLKAEMSEAAYLCEWASSKALIPGPIIIPDSVKPEWLDWYTRYAKWRDAFNERRWPRERVTK